MEDILNCKKCKVKPYFAWGNGADNKRAFDIAQIRCPKCGKEIRLFLPNQSPIPVLSLAIETWNYKNFVKTNKSKKCKDCESFVDVGYKDAKRCLKKGKCDE